jgi:hypothetical protein
MKIINKIITVTALLTAIPSFAFNTKSYIDRMCVISSRYAEVWAQDLKEGHSESAIKAHTIKHHTGWSEPDGKIMLEHKMALLEWVTTQQPEPRIARQKAYFKCKAGDFGSLPHL